MSENKQAIEVGDVVQLDPEFHFGAKQGFFGGCFMLVTEIKSFGAQGFIAVPGERGSIPGAAFYRAKWDEMHRIGKAEWAPPARAGDD